MPIKVTALGALKNSDTHSRDSDWVWLSWGLGTSIFKIPKVILTVSYYGEAWPWSVQSPAVLLRVRAAFAFSSPPVLLPRTRAAPVCTSSAVSAPAEETGRAWPSLI